eukprot:2618036-Lingulodinium_polyedra.AAC.1
MTVSRSNNQATSHTVTHDCQPVRPSAGQAISQSVTLIDWVTDCLSLAGVSQSSRQSVSESANQ